MELRLKLNRYMHPPLTEALMMIKLRSGLIKVQYQFLKLRARMKIMSFFTPISK